MYIVTKIANVAIVGLMAMASTAHADELTLSGNAAGHFNTGSATTYGGLTYTGSSFNATTAGNFYALGGGSASEANNLGRIRLLPVNFNYSNPPTTFTLDVAFTSPTGIVGNSSAHFNASLVGQVTNQNGGVNIDFVNTPQLFTFADATGAGSFTLTVNDVAVFPGKTASITGYGTGTYSAVPEPVSMACLAAGIGGMLVRRKKKQTS